MKRSLLKLVCLATLALPMLLTHTAKADPVGGSIFRSFSISANRYQTFTVNAYGNEVTRFTLRGDGDTDLDLFVYDCNGNLVVSDTGPSDQAVLLVTPFYTQTLTIKIVNHGSVYNDYSLSID
jgi:hypothetical protein